MKRALVRIAAVVVLLWALGFAIFVVALPGPVDGPATDVIVVPTGGGGRIARGNVLLLAGKAQRMFISGVGPKTSAAAIARENGFDRRLFACCVDVGNEASDTRTNAQETVAWLRAHKVHSVRLVTTDWHMPRARFELDRVVGPGVTIVDDAVESQADFDVLMREYNKYLLRRIAVPFGL